MIREIGNSSFLGLLLCAYSVIAFADEGKITVGQPTGNGSVTVDVSIPGIVASGQVSGSAARVTVTGIKATDTPAQKAIKIANAINTAFGAPPNVAGINAGNSSQIDLVAPSGPDKGKAGVAKIPKGGDKTGEGNLLAQVDIPFSGDGTQLAGLIDYDTGLSGVDANGAASIFSASIGYDGLNDSATLSYNQLSSPTLDGLTTDMYNQLSMGLPSALRPDLVLDLPDDEILFNFPGGQTNDFVQNSSTDTGVGLSGGLAYVTPEPSTLFLLGAGLIVLLAGSVRSRHRLR